jgi:microsomal dipeptidase-like Zn-dependent dipeptidase
MRRAAIVILAVALLSVLLARPAVRLADHILNSTSGSPPWLLTDSTTAVHSSLWIGDLHSDALMWNRGLLERSPRGHVDLPRLLEAGVDLECFSVPTRVHVFSNYRRTPPVGDLFAPLAFAHGWPRSAWTDPRARAQVQARMLYAAERASLGRLRVVETGADFDSLLADQARGERVVGGVLLLEGMHGLRRDVSSIDTLFAAGFRVFGLVHMFDNEVAGSAHGWRKGGLTAFGRAAVGRLDSLGAIIDLAHASGATIDDVLALTSRPPLISHTGVTGTCPGPRNVSDDVLVRVAGRGGLVGIGFWDEAVCGDDARAIARAIGHAVRVAGIEHVALGSDFDGAVRVPFDATGLPLVTAALMEQGFSRDEVAAVMGGNVRRFLRASLPAGGAGGYPGRRPSAQKVQYQ